MGARTSSEPTMQIAKKWTMPWVVVAIGLSMIGCSKEEEQPKPAPSVAKPPPPPPPAPTPPVPEKPPEPKLNPNCPSGSKGEGSLGSPCEASGTDRVMDVAWNGKMDEKGPLFKVTNRTKSAILYGKIVIYFYDKSGKQLEVASTGSDKGKPYLSCSGNLFGGVVKPSEKFTLTFSCAKKERVPEGTKSIEAEAQMVGFADASEKAVDYYWRNNDLAPEERKKAGK